jgi:uncharacterized protein TIGR03905
METYKRKNNGTCSRTTTVTMDGNIISNVEFEAGCAGNLAGISALVKGMAIDDAIAKLGGIKCGYKNTSCPDQLAQTLAEYKEKNS